MSRHSLDAPLAAGENVDTSETDAHLLMRRQPKQAFLHGCVTAAPAACAGWLDVVAADRSSVHESNLIGVVGSCVRHHSRRVPMPALRRGWRSKLATIPCCT